MSNPMLITHDPFIRLYIHLHYLLYNPTVLGGCSAFWVLRLVNFIWAWLSFLLSLYGVLAFLSN